MPPQTYETYLIITGTVFGLLAAAHIWRAIAEGPQLATNPIFILTTSAAIALCIWACRLIQSSSRS